MCRPADFVGRQVGRSHEKTQREETEALELGGVPDQHWFFVMLEFDSYLCLRSGATLDKEVEKPSKRLVVSQIEKGRGVIQRITVVY